MYYAIQWTYGRAGDGRTGKRCGAYYGFRARADRDAWVQDRRTEYTTRAGYREPIRSDDAELRADLRADRRDAALALPPQGVTEIVDYVANCEADRVASAEQDEALRAEAGVELAQAVLAGDERAQQYTTECEARSILAEQTEGRALLRAAIAASDLSARRYATEVLTRDERTVRRWLAGKSPIPQAVLRYLESRPTT